MTTNMIQLDSTRDLTPEALDANGRPRVLPAAYWAKTTPAERGLFGHRHGAYCFPTLELVRRLRELIGERSAIEIGAGNGVLAEALGIPATDSFQQAEPKYAAVYAALAHPTVSYGPNVSACHASRAVRKYRPQVVLGAWVTHKYDARNHEAGGNEVGIDEADILANCETLILVGNEKVHAAKPIWRRPHAIEFPPYVFSRAMNGSRDFIAVWNGAHHKGNP